jgi:DNA-binding transcriptional LysR family regulator
MEPYRQMAVFAAVVEAGSFTGAAQRLGLAKSAVSRTVTELEQSLGVSLLSRTTRHVALTEPGALYYRGCAAMVAEAQAATASLREYGAEPSGRLRLTAPLGLTRDVLALTSEMAGVHPQLSFELRFEDRHAHLLEEDIDVAVRGGRLPDSGLSARLVSEVLQVVCASPEYLARRGIPRTSRELREHDWLGTTIALPPVLEIPPRRRFELSTGDAALVLLLEGQGLTLAPLWGVLGELRAGRLQVVLADVPLPRSALHAVSPAGRQDLPKVSAFNRRLLAHARTCGWDRLDPGWVAR